MPTTTLTRDEYFLAMASHPSSTLTPFYADRTPAEYIGGEGEFSLAMLSTDLAWDEID